MTPKLQQEKSIGIPEMLKHIHFLRNADENELKFLAMNCELLKCSRFEVLYHKDDISDSIYYVLSGIVKVSAHSIVAKEVIRSIIHTSMTFGEDSLCGEKHRNSMAQILDKKSEIIKINSRALKKVFVQNGAVSTDFLEIVGNKLRATQSRLESIIVEDARTRVINFLKENAMSFGNKVGFNELLLKHSFTQQDIADFTGTSRQTVTTVLNDLKRSNIISLDRRRILIRDFAQLS
jgi:CRP/FNR family transcriptional regulator, cyclic AMP receptor protein